MAYIRSGNGGGGGSITDIIKQKVADGLDVNYTLTPHSGRANIAEGGIAIDTTNRIVYLYADFTMLSDVGSTSDWFGIIKTTTQVPSSYMPRNNSSSSSRNSSMQIVNDGSSDTNNPVLFVQAYQSTTYIGSGYKKFLTGERYIVYEVWSY